MEKDIVPGLLELIEQEFDEKILNSETVKNAIKALRDKKATYKEARDFAVEVGDILAELLNAHVTVETLPDGRMYFNIADRVINTTLKKSFELISGYTLDVQTELNYAAGLKIKGQAPKVNQNKIDGMVERLSTEEFESIKWVLDEPIKNFSQAIVDSAVRANVTFQAKAGLDPRIKRIAAPGVCDWCRGAAGTYSYEDAPYNIYQRHRYCRCRVEFEFGDGRIQDAHTKEWVDPERNAKIEARKQIGVRETLSERK